MSESLPRAAEAASFKVICISIYKTDLAALDQVVEQLKDRGIKRASRSALIRYALTQIDIERVPETL